MWALQCISIVTQQFLSHKCFIPYFKDYLEEVKMFIGYHMTHITGCTITDGYGCNSFLNHLYKNKFDSTVPFIELKFSESQLSVSDLWNSGSPGWNSGSPGNMLSLLQVSLLFIFLGLGIYNTNSSTVYLQVDLEGFAIPPQKKNWLQISNQCFNFISVSSTRCDWIL